jgi:prolyl 4-hydroxylase
MDRLDIGPFVHNRLRHHPTAFRLPAAGLEIFTIRAFLSEAECAGLIALIDADRRPSGLLAYDPDPAFRTSETCDLSLADPLVIQIEKKLTGLTGIDPPYGEPIQGQRYAPGQQFKPHHDYFHVGQPYWAEQERMGGQRTWTAMAFLNAPEAGGQTAFPEVGLAIAPKAGNLLVWNNLDPLGEPNPLSLHQGRPVEAGVKYVITKWYRERPWASSLRKDEPLAGS